MENDHVCIEVGFIFKLNCCNGKHCNSIRFAFGSSLIFLGFIKNYDASRPCSMGKIPAVLTRVSTESFVETHWSAVHAIDRRMNQGWRLNPVASQPSNYFVGTLRMTHFLFICHFNANLKSFPST